LSKSESFPERAKADSSFEEVMQEVIDKNPKEAAPGGNPEIDARVKGYVAVVLRSQEKIDTYKPQVSHPCMCNADRRPSTASTSTPKCTTYSELATRMR
jgi:hypothetical protein